MGKIRIHDIGVDTEDIDLLVRLKPLAELDKLINFDRILLQEMPEDDPDRAYWEHRANTHEIAREIAEWYWGQGVQWTDLSAKKDNFSESYLAIKLRDFEKRLNGIEAYFTEKQAKRGRY